MLRAMYIVVLKKRAEKQYGKLPEHDRWRVLLALQGLRQDPWQGKKLKSDLKGLYTIRVWPYRIIYTIERRMVTVAVVAIGHRKDVYRRL